MVARSAHPSIFGKRLSFRVRLQVSLDEMIGFNDVVADGRNGDTKPGADFIVRFLFKLA